MIQLLAFVWVSKSHFHFSLKNKITIKTEFDSFSFVYLFREFRNPFLITYD